MMHLNKTELVLLFDIIIIIWLLLLLIDYVTNKIWIWFILILLFHQIIIFIHRLDDNHYLKPIPRFNSLACISSGKYVNIKSM